MQRAYLHGAYLVEAHLSDAHLEGAHLCTPAGQRPAMVAAVTLASAYTDDKTTMTDWQRKTMNAYAADVVSPKLRGTGR